MTINPKAEKTINEIYSKVNIEDYNIKISDKKTLNEKYLKNIFGEADNNTIYVRPGIYAMSTRKIESLIALAEIQRYYQANPVRFIDDWFNIELLDAQAYIVQRAWVWEAATSDDLPICEYKWYRRDSLGNAKDSAKPYATAKVIYLDKDVVDGKTTFGCFADLEI